MSSENALAPNIQAGKTLHSSSTDYTIVELIGEGCFGKVAKCKNLQTGDTVAIKVLKKVPQLFLEADNEVSILKTISVLDPDSIHVVKFLEQFHHMELTCLAFEMLEVNLHGLLEHNNWDPMHLRKIRPIAKQLFVALAALQTFGLLHTDIKPDNIMVVKEQEESIRIKLIDFGLAIPASKVQLGLMCQPVGYRAPEVTLGLSYTEAIDVWGVGCVLGFLFLAQNLFPVFSDYRMVKRMVEILGQPADHLLWGGGFTHRFFTLEEILHHQTWRLQTPEEFAQRNGAVPKGGDSSDVLPKSLDDMTDLYPEVLTGEAEDTKAFVSLMKGLLHLDGSRRLTPHQALQHPFITMTHLSHNEDFSDYLSGSQQKMSNCQETGEVTRPVEQADSWNSISSSEVTDDKTNGDGIPPLPQWVDHSWCPEEQHPGPQSWNYDVDQPNQSRAESEQPGSWRSLYNGDEHLWAEELPPVSAPAHTEPSTDQDEDAAAEPAASEPSAALGQDKAAELEAAEPPVDLAEDAVAAPAPTEHPENLAEDDSAEPEAAEPPVDLAQDAAAAPALAEPPVDLAQDAAAEPAASEPSAEPSQDEAAEPAATEPPASANTSSVGFRKRLRRFFKAVKKRAIRCFCCCCCAAED